MQLRAAQSTDLEAVYDLIKELAAHQNAAEEVSLSLAQFKKDFTQANPPFSILICEKEKEVLGFALYFYTYSTWKGKCLYLEDIYVKKTCRKQGVGRKLMNALAKEAQKAGAKRMAWQVLDSNHGAIAFYEKMPTNRSASWINVKIESDNLEKLYQNDGF